MKNEPRLTTASLLLILITGCAAPSEPRVEDTTVTTQASDTDTLLVEVVGGEKGGIHYGGYKHHEVFDATLEVRAIYQDVFVVPTDYSDPDWLASFEVDSGDFRDGKWIHDTGLAFSECKDLDEGGNAFHVEAVLRVEGQSASTHYDFVYWPCP